MVFHKWRTIFIGIAKNASSSIYWSLMNKSDQICVEHNHNTMFEDFEHHDEDLLNSYYSFAVVRNPYTRFYSAWKHNNPHPGPMPEEDYIVEFNNWIEKFEDPNEFWDLKRHPHFIPQYKYVSLHNKVVVDRLLRFENLHDDWNDMIKFWNKNSLVPFKKSVALKHENEGAQTIYWEEIYSNRSKEIISNYYRKDFDLFKYQI